MNFDDMLKNRQYDEIWQKYCSFLDLSISQYMTIQKSLLMEQVELFANCELGLKIMRGQHPRTVDEFRSIVPLTNYEDYADYLLAKNNNVLPSNAVVWIETTWEGGKAPVKCAPYTETMIKYHRDICITCFILASSKEKGKFNLKPGMNFLNGMAPLPYITGLLPYTIQGEYSVNFFPSIDEGNKMSFGQRNKEGFRMGIEQGIDLFYGLSSVIVRMGEQFSEGGKGTKVNLMNFKPSMLYKFAKAKVNSKLRHKPMLPKDVFNLKGFVCAGTDTTHFKKKIEEYWGIKPLEIFGGTEATCIACESWSKNGLIMFPNVCFYEFIPMGEFYKNLEDPSYQCRTYLMDEIKEDEYYEIVITTLKGGAFARYRIGDIFKCEVLARPEDGIMLPHFRYVDRIDPIIDLAGFTRITEATINEVLHLSHLHIDQWFARKSYDSEKRPYINLCVEINHSADDPGIDDADLIKEQLEIYFKYIDSDYKNLQRMLGIEPLKVTILTAGSIQKYQRTIQHKISKVNPSHYDVMEILKIAYKGEGGDFS